MPDEKVKVTFTREKETPNTIRFKEDGDEAKHVVGTLYVKKSAKLSGKQTIEAEYTGKD